MGSCIHSCIHPSLSIPQIVIDVSGIIGVALAAEGDSKGLTHLELPLEYQHSSGPDKKEQERQREDRNRRERERETTKKGQMRGKESKRKCIDQISS